MPNLDSWANWAQIVSLPVAIVATMLTIWLYSKSKQKRAITCELDTIVSPVEIKAGEALKGDIVISYKGKPVENLFLVRAKLKNTGNIAIRHSDVFEPVTFTFDANAELLRQPEVIKKRPENLKIAWAFGATESISRPNIASISFELLNPGEGLTVEFICTGKSAVPKVTARIDGIRDIVMLESEEVELRRGIRISAYVFAAFFAASFLGLAFRPSGGLASPFVLSVIVGALAASLKAPLEWFVYQIRKKNKPIGGRLSDA